MQFHINDKEPIYLQIIRHIKRSIVLGTLLPGDIIPSRRELAEILTVNANTVQRAYKDMEAMGLINTVRNSQSTITLDRTIISNIKEELIDDSLNVFMENMKSIKVTKSQLIDLINERYYFKSLSVLI